MLAAPPARRPVYPLSQPSAAQILPDNYNETTFNIGATTRPLCLFPLDDALLSAAGVTQQQLDDDADLDRTVYEVGGRCAVAARRRAADVR